jgi:uncharacterized membrane protein
MSAAPAKYELLLKVIAWRAVSIACNFLITLAFTGEVGKSAGISVITGIVLMFFHWFFEVVWDGQFRKRIRNVLTRK